jgi:TonB family protein
MRQIVASTILFSSLLFPAAAMASSPVADSDAPTPSVRVSTGITAPVVIDAANITLSNSYSMLPLPVDSTVTISLKVDASGQPHDIQIVKSVNPFWDARVIDAVQQFHFRPGTLDSQAIPMEMNLLVTIQK